MLIHSTSDSISIIGTKNKINYDIPAVTKKITKAIMIFILFLNLMVVSLIEEIKNVHNH